MANDLPPTAPPITELRVLKRSRLLRRVGIGAIAAFVLCGAVGLLGIRTETATASGGGVGRFRMRGGPAPCFGGETRGHHRLPHSRPPGPADPLGAHRPPGGGIR